MTIVASTPEELDKVKPTDSIVFVHSGTATAINSASVKAGMHTLEEYCQQHGWALPTKLEPEQVTLGSRLKAIVQKLIG